MEGTTARGHIAPPGVWHAEARATFALAWPIALTNLLQIVVLLTNTAFVGHLGTNELAAVTIGSSIFFALQPPTLGLALAAAPMLAQARGAGRRRDGPRRGWVGEMRRSARQALWAVAVVAVPSWALLWQVEALLLAFGQDPTISALAADYVRPLMWGLPLLGAFVVLRGFLAAMGQPGLALSASCVGIVVNAVLCWALVFGALGAPRLGAMGAGLAGALVNLCMVLVLLGLIRLDRRLRRFRLLGQLWQPDWTSFREVFRIGLPIAGQMWVEIGLFAGAALVIGWLGAVAVAAHAIAVQMAMLAFRVPMGVGLAATARVGQAIGAADPAAAVRAGWVAVALGSSFVAATALLIVAGRSVLPGIFLGTADPMAPAVATSAAVLLIIVALFQLANGVQVVAAGALRGLRDTRVPALLVGAGYWGIGLPVGWVLGFRLGLGAAGVWLGLTSGMAMVAVLLLLRLRLLAVPSRGIAVSGKGPPDR